MAKQAADRYQTAQELADLLESCIAHVQQPNSNPLPGNIGLSKPTTVSSSVFKTLSRMAGSNKGKIGIVVLAIAGMIAVSGMQRPTLQQDFEKLQGEWLLVSSERDGRAIPKDQLYNERLLIQGMRFSRHQTAPSGLEIKGESGEIAREAETGENSINFKIRGKGTVYGICKLEGDKLVLCVTREGHRPDNFETTDKDLRVLQMFKRTKSMTLTDFEEAPKGSSTTWTKEWMDKITKALDVSKNPETAMQWMRDNGFQNIEAKAITTEVIRRIHPDADAKSVRETVSSYVHGLLTARPDDDNEGAIEVICLFGSDGKFAGLVIGPRSTPK